MALPIVAKAVRTGAAAVLLVLASLAAAPGALAHAGHHDDAVAEVPNAQHALELVILSVETSAVSIDAAPLITSDVPRPQRATGCLAGCCTAVACGMCCAALIPAVAESACPGAAILSALAPTDIGAGIGRMPDIPPPRSCS
jgi:hypothetical protein